MKTIYKYFSKNERVPLQSLKFRVIWVEWCCLNVQLYISACKIVLILESKSTCYVNNITSVRLGSVQQIVH